MRIFESQNLKLTILTYTNQMHVSSVFQAMLNRVDQEGVTCEDTQEELFHLLIDA